MNDTQEATKGESTPSKGTLASYAQNFTKESIDVLVEIMRDTNPKRIAYRMGAAKILLDKTLPDVKALEIGGVNGEPIKLNIIAGADYISQFGVSTTPSTTSIAYRPASVQSAGVASESAKNNNSDNTTSEVGTA